MLDDLGPEPAISAGIPLVSQVFKVGRPGKDDIGIHGVSGHKPVEDHHKIKFSETCLEKLGVGEACQDGCPKD